MKALAGRAGRNFFLAAALLFFGIPLVWMLIAPTKTYDQLLQTPALQPGSVSNIGLAWSHISGYGDGILWRWALNSLVYTVGATALAVILAVPAGYGLAKFEFPGRKVVLFLTLITMIVPSAALILPLYLQMSVVGLVDTAWAVILPLAFYPFGVYLIYLYAATTMPDSVIEAARLDGASEAKILTRVFIPMARPAIVMVIFFSFVSAWNNYFLPYIMLTSASRATLQTGLQLMVANTGALTGVNFTGTPIKAPEIVLAALFSVMPILLIFIFAQRYLVAGQTQVDKG